MVRRAEGDPLAKPMSIYEVHLGSWRWTTGGPGGTRPLSYLELAEELPKYVAEMGFTHVEFLPVAEHPFGGSWGYQVSAYYAPTARFGPPDDFRTLGGRIAPASGIGVIVDWVPAHFPRDEFALARFDGTALYEHAGPMGSHPDWGTLVFNLGRHEVRNFLVANALFWLNQYHVDALRVDAVASMLYLDYSRQAGRVGAERVRGQREPRSRLVLERAERDDLFRVPGGDHHRRGVDGMAGRVPAYLPRRPRVWLQVEHGVDARHAQVFRDGPAVPALPPERPHFRPVVRLAREFHPAPFPRRGGPRQAFDAVEDARVTAGASSPTCGRFMHGCGRTPARSCFSWAANWREEREWDNERPLDWWVLDQWADHAKIAALGGRDEQALPSPAGSVGTGLQPRRFPLDRCQ